MRENDDDKSIGFLHFQVPKCRWIQWIQQAVKSAVGRSNLGCDQIKFGAIGIFKGPIFGSQMISGIF